jgi:hypothetical protein
VRAIWSTDEAQDLKQGVQEKAGPAASKLKKGVEAGYKAMTDDKDGSGSAGGSGSAAGSAVGSGSAKPAVP